MNQHASAPRGQATVHGRDHTHPPVTHLRDLKGLPSRSMPDHRVWVVRHEVNLGVRDQDEVTAARIMSEGRLSQFHWVFANPGFTVLTNALSPVFLDVVKRWTSQWQSRVYQTFRRPSSYLRTIRQEAGTQDADNLAYHGVVLHQGAVLPWQVWQPMSDDLLAGGNRVYEVTWRPQAQHLLRGLRGDTLAGLQRYSADQLGPVLPRLQTGVFYHCPGLTLSAPRADEAFLKEARRFRELWKTWIKRSLGDRIWRALSGADMEPSTRHLAVYGLLCIDGHAYDPDAWPDRPVKPTRLLQRPGASQRYPLTSLAIGSPPQHLG